MLKRAVCKNIRRFNVKCVNPLSYDNYRSFEYRMLKVRILTSLKNKEKISICTSYTGHVSSYQIYYKYVETEININLNSEMIVDKLSECIYDYPDKFISLFSYIHDEENDIDKLDSIYIVRLPQNYYDRGGPIRLGEDLNSIFPYPW